MKRLAMRGGVARDAIAPGRRIRRGVPKWEVSLAASTVEEEGLHLRLS